MTPENKEVSPKKGKQRSGKKGKLWRVSSLILPSQSQNGTPKGKSIEENGKSHSTIDVRNTSDNEEGTSTLRRRNSMWASLKKSARRLRSRSREKKRIRNLSSSQPDVSNNNFDDRSASNNVSGQDEHFDHLFQDAAERHRRSFTDTEDADTDGPLADSSRISRQDSEVDSGITVVDNHDVIAMRNRDSLFRSHPFFQLDCHLISGHNLVVRDRGGTSDPYVKFRVNNKLLYKSRTIFKNLHPYWDEKFSLPIEDVYKPLQLKVFDYDRGISDDPMGSAEINLTSLELNVAQDLKLKLSEKPAKGQKEENMGYLSLKVTLLPKTQDEKDQYLKKSMKLGDTAKKLKTQIWSGVVTIVLVEGKDLLPMDDNGFSDPYVKFRLGSEKFKSKWKAKTLNPRWLEQFDLHMFEDQTCLLEISVWDHDTAGKDDIMGRAVIDLTDMKREITHTIEQTLDDGAGHIKILLTMSGSAGTESISDLSNYTPNPREREAIIRRYGLFNSLKNIKDVGYLQVKVIKADSLTAADIGGKSDPFCVLELVNSRLQTQTEYKTLSPDWGKVFTFNVKDIHSVLEVSVFDEDRDKKSEFLGKVAIPILRIIPGERRWFTLKDKKLTGRAKGAIQLEMDFVYNHVKAAIRTFNPREEKYMQPEPKFKISIMKRNIDRVSKFIDAGIETGKFIQSCFEWESSFRTITAFMVFLLIVWNFELYMLPITLLIIFFKNLLIVYIAGNLLKKEDEDVYVDDEDDDEEDAAEKEEKKSFKEKLQAIQDVCLTVQEAMDMIASVGERVKNTFNWTVPWLSWLAIIVLSIASVILYNVPLRYIVLAWGINKFTKKLRAPNAIPNNELLDYLSRVPSDKELVMYRELRPDASIGTNKKKRTT